MADTKTRLSLRMFEHLKKAQELSDEMWLSRKHLYDAARKNKYEHEDIQQAFGELENMVGVACVKHENGGLKYKYYRLDKDMEDMIRISIELFELIK